MRDRRPVAEALAEYRAGRGIPADGGSSARWVRVRFLGMPVWFPNFEARRCILFPHDVHHLLTGYETSWRGEAEIGGFELASGCRRFWAAWMFNSGGFLFGLVIAPQRMFRAFVHGRRCRNFYGADERAVAALTVDAARGQLGLDRPAPTGTRGDAIWFAAWAVGVVAFWLVLPAALVAVVWFRL